MLEHSDAVGVLVEDEEQRAKIAGAALRARDHASPTSTSCALAAASSPRSSPNALAEAEAAVGEEDLFTFIYTSGTTGPPKGCMIRHRNYYEMAGCVDHVEAFAFSDDTMLLYLPLAHNFGRLMHLLGAHVGYTIAFCPDPLRIAEALPAVRPTLLPSVPRLYEKVHTALQAQFDVTHGVEAPSARLRAANVGRQVSELRRAGPTAARRAGAAPPARRPARLPQGRRTGSADGCASASPAARRSRRRSASSSTRSTS